MQDCIFCKIVKGEAPAKIELETDSIIAFASIAPAADTHILVVPKTHISTFIDLEEDHKDVFMQMTKAVQKIIEMKKISGAYKLVFNGGKYQSVKHIHWHVLGGDLENENQPIAKT